MLVKLNRRHEKIGCLGASNSQEVVRIEYKRIDSKYKIQFERDIPQSATDSCRFKKLAS